jgi:hypothetical protein
MVSVEFFIVLLTALMMNEVYAECRFFVVILIVTMNVLDAESSF